MEFLKKLRDTLLSMAPIVLIVLIVHAFFARVEADLLVRFLFSAVLIAVGEVLFLSGTDNSIMPMGELVGNSAGVMKNISVLIFFSFIFGLFATIAEPDVNVLATEVSIWD